MHFFALRSTKVLQTYVVVSCHQIDMQSRNHESKKKTKKQETPSGSRPSTLFPGKN